ncbi:hypothetical protein AAHA92_01005 [Salvia divinorum]|uniref:Uncharacterized protein n=1 Tax=Salvia divinorum TaxID=28513 RepID=A0ABD1IMK3_SALDI
MPDPKAVVNDGLEDHRRAETDEFGGSGDDSETDEQQLEETDKGKLKEVASLSNDLGKFRFQLQLFYPTKV